MGCSRQRRRRKEKKWMRRRRAPDWDGMVYPQNAIGYSGRSGFGGPSLKFLRFSGCSEGVQGRMVQDNYHEAVDNAAQWEASFCSAPQKE